MQRETFTAKEKETIRKNVPAIVAQVKNNLCRFKGNPVPVLLAGGGYDGIWLEHNQDNLFLADLAPESAWASQELFMDHQRSDGLLPFMFRRGEGPSYWHLQTVWPFAACAYAIARKLDKGISELRRIYDCGSRYDAWLERNRNRLQTGLVELYCEWDTGHDNDPRVTDGGIPHTCPGDDAANMPDLPVMPILSADLSAMRYGGCIALAELAARLNMPEKERSWRNKAAEIRTAMRQLLYDADDEFYYDRDPTGLRKYRSEHITRLFLNRVTDQQEFDRIYQRYFTSDQEFATPFPFPSMSVSDPHFVPGAPANCWGCNSQALTALRAILWMEHYGKREELAALLSCWLRAFLDSGVFPQELDPFTGAPVGTKDDYSPALLLYLAAARFCLT
ncbi:MGH1-like glycoside hydrolase domain-containing protein [Victivallis vadensis]|uniref:MGH1-like glycoside hydrolase domain-containing protein n=1 Tax=Victivallis vadensis TaxID=172901 RepID=UPI003D053200